MKGIHTTFVLAGTALLWAAGAGQPAQAAVLVQCPGDLNGDAVHDERFDETQPENVRCMHLAAGDGFARMGDGSVQYVFSFADITGTPERRAMQAGMLAAQSPAPTIVLKENEEFYLTLTNVGMVMRPDLFDPHTVHFHGFPNASAILDGVPDASISVNMGASLTYFYKLAEPGTYMYHCHVEATEHMQMGMLGNLYVKPAQNGTPMTYEGREYTQFVYNDGDGSTGYDVEYPIQIGSFDHLFHEASLATQPLGFAAMRDTYPLLNGRGYPDTVHPGALPALDEEFGGKVVQEVSSLVEAEQGQKILLRISNLNITNFYTLTALGLPMRVVGEGARLLRGPDGKDLDYLTGSVTLGGGEAVDVIIDTAQAEPGTYFLYTTNLNYLSNNDEDFGGMMTEIRIAEATAL